VWGLLAVELLGLATIEHRQVASVWELRWGVGGLGPAALALASVFGASGACLGQLLARGRRTWARATLVALAAVFGAFVGWGVGGGRHLASVGARGGFAVAVALLGALAAYSSAPFVDRLLERRAQAVRAGALIFALLLEIANRFVLVRLYPAFHRGLFALELLAVAALLPAVPGGLPSGQRRWLGWAEPILTGVLTLAAWVTAKPLAACLAYSDNFRLLALEKAPLLGQAVRFAAWLEPPAPLGEAEGPGQAGLATPGNRERPLDWAARDLLLVSIDAVRADHVGAYGYPRRTTPTFDRLARGGAVFEHAYCVTPHTSYSVTSLMTGKYLRPLLIQGAGQDSDTWAGLLRTYGYHTAGFYPPALFFIDAARFETFRDRFLDFEYRKFEFLEGQARVEQVAQYLAGEPRDRRLFLWVHLFAPHEPYVLQSGHDFGPHDVDRYDSEIAYADQAAGEIIDRFLAVRPHSVVMMTSDHGEEFGDHGGHYHGTTVYEEQVRVPLVVWEPSTVPAHRIAEPVQIIDLLPTVLGALDIPRPPRIRGRDLGALLRESNPPSGPGFAYAETEEQALLAYGPWRLVCARQIGACRLFDIGRDPTETRDLGPSEPDRFSDMRQRLRQVSASHGQFERTGLMAEGRKWPPPILRGAAGDAEAAEEIASLLDDADRVVRRKAAELLFQLKRPSTAAALRLALTRDEDETVRRWCALALTRLGEGAPLVFEIADLPDQNWRRLGALVLAEQGDRRGEAALIGWWKDEAARDYARSRELLNALAKIRSKQAVWPLIQTLGDVRLRPFIAATLAEIGDEAARVPLARALAEERYQGARVAITRSLVELRASFELAEPLVRFLGVPDPLPDGIGYALRTKILEHVGGPNRRDLASLVKQIHLGTSVVIVVPRGGNGTGVRAIVRGRAVDGQAGTLRVGLRLVDARNSFKNSKQLSKEVPKIDPTKFLELSLPAAAEPVEVYATVPPSMGAGPGRSIELVVFASRNVELEGLGLVPLADELPPPPPQAWHAEAPAEKRTD
jgi:arylsulfatase A-like enzyme